MVIVYFTVPLQYLYSPITYNLPYPLITNFTKIDIKSLIFISAPQPRELFST